MKVLSLRIYPIKSLGSIELDEVLALSTGLQWDRRWMLIDEDGLFLTQRKLAELCLFEQDIDAHRLLVRKGGRSIEIPLDEKVSSKEILPVVANIWGHAVPVQEVSAEISSWFSEQLNQSVRLVRMNERSERIAEKNGESTDLQMNLADGYPILILGSASLDHLNEKLEEKIAMDRFRPNIIVSTNVAHEEDEWPVFQIGKAAFRISHPCARCIVTTINPATASRGKEPLKTLSTYRKVGERVNFGANTFCESEGSIRVGDQVRF